MKHITKIISELNKSGVSEGIEEELKSFNDKQLIVYAELLIFLLFFEKDDATYDILTSVLAEMCVRGDCATKFLWKLEDLCSEGIVKPYFVLFMVVSCELTRNDAATLLKEQVESGELRSWVRSIYTEQLSIDMVSRITEADIDRVEETFLETYAEIISNPQ